MNITSSLLFEILIINRTYPLLRNYVTHNIN